MKQKPVRLKVNLDRTEIDQTKAVLRQGMSPKQIRQDIKTLVEAMPEGKMRDTIFLHAELTLQQAEKELGMVFIN